jgi:hypothetical protein
MVREAGVGCQKNFAGGTAREEIGEQARAKQRRNPCPLEGSPNLAGQMDSHLDSAPADKVHEVSGLADGYLLPKLVIKVGVLCSSLSPSGKRTGGI